MTILKRSASMVSALVMMISGAGAYNCSAEGTTVNDSNTNNTREIVIDGTTAQLKENMRYRGAGMVSANNSSRLLLDYKAEHPDVYEQIMEYMFGKEGIGITHLKLEMGADINSSSGTEPSVMRTEDEKADVTRGAAYQLAADAKKINPDLTLDMLWWSEPKWVSDASDVYAARYKWYKNTLDAAYETYGLEFDYVSAVQNERGADLEWVKYLSSHLKNEKGTPYDYSKIKIVGGEEVCTWGFADRMYEDSELMNVVDVVGSHYTSESTENAQKLAYEENKELWFSEASSPMAYAQGTYRYDGSGLAGINGTLDIANRIIGMYPNGKMTLYEYQPVVSAYYDGACYCQKQLISACDPWSGYYMLDSGFYMSLHFSQFIEKGWAFVDSGCYSDGKKGGDGHAIVDAVYSYMTATDTETGDYSTVITNTTSEPIQYDLKVSGLDKASSNVSVWETRGPDSIDDSYDENYFKKTEDITPTENGGAYTYSVTVKPNSIVTISTVTPERTEYKNADESERTVLKLPYSDDFEYAGYSENYLSSRGNAPRYTTDQGGAFEVEKTNKGNMLVQQITADMKANEWGYTPEPVTTFGDDRWYNYSVNVDAAFATSQDAGSNYVGVGLRYTLGCNSYSGYWIKLYENGSWELKANDGTLSSGSIDSFDGTASHKLKVEAVNNVIRGYIDGNMVAEYTVNEGESLIGAGRASLFSSYNKNSFDNFSAEPVEGSDTYVTRFDETDSCFTFDGNWEHNLMSSFKNYKRTISDGTEDDSFTVSFEGTGFALSGETRENAILGVSIDGGDEQLVTVSRTGQREISCHFEGLSEGAHTAKVTIKSGKYTIDAMQVTGGKIPFEKKKPAKSESTKSGKSKLPIAVGAGVCAAAAVGAVIYGIVRKKRKENND